MDAWVPVTAICPMFGGWGVDGGDAGEWVGLGGGWFLCLRIVSGILSLDLFFGERWPRRTLRSGTRLNSSH